MKFFMIFSIFILSLLTIAVYGGLAIKERNKEGYLVYAAIALIGTASCALSSHLAYKLLFR